MHLADSAETARYVPLEIGDTWGYVVPRAEGSSQSEDPEAYRVFTLIGDTVIESVGYFKAVSTTYSVDLEKEFERRLLLRRDSLGQVLSRSDELPWKLSPLAQNPASQQYYVREEITTERDTNIDIGGVQYAAESVRRTLFVGSYSDHDERVHAAGIGLLRSSWCGLTCVTPQQLRLQYAKVGGVTYGQSTVSTYRERRLYFICFLVGGFWEMKIAAVSLYANPTQDHIVVYTPCGTGRPANFSIYDALGRRVKTLSTYKCARGESEFKIDVSDLAPGMYLIERLVARSATARTFIVTP